MIISAAGFLLSITPFFYFSQSCKQACPFCESPNDSAKISNIRGITRHCNIVLGEVNILILFFGEIVHLAPVNKLLKCISFILHVRTCYNFWFYFVSIEWWLLYILNIQLLSCSRITVFSSNTCGTVNICSNGNHGTLRAQQTLLHTCKSISFRWTSKVRTFKRKICWLSCWEMKVNNIRDSVIISFDYDHKPFEM